MASRSLKLLLLLLVPCFASAQTKYADPDSPAVQAAAQAALSHAKVVDIVGMTSGIQGVLQDLKAKVTEHEVKIELDADVLFDFDKYNLRPEAADSLREVGEVAKSYGNSPVLIEGHTDSKGSPPYNMKLSENRAALGQELAGAERRRFRVAYNDSRLRRNQASCAQHKPQWHRQSRGSPEEPQGRDHNPNWLNVTSCLLERSKVCCESLRTGPIYTASYEKSCGCRIVGSASGMGKDAMNSLNRLPERRAAKAVFSAIFSGSFLLSLTHAAILLLALSTLLSAQVPTEMPLMATEQEGGTNKIPQGSRPMTFAGCDNRSAIPDASKVPGQAQASNLLILRDA